MSSWIKLDRDTARKPEVLRMARMLNLSRRECFGAVVEFWIWADAATVDGVVDGLASHDVDAMMDCQGFAKAMAAVGWLEMNDDLPSIRVPNFHRHNGNSAKNRALKSERQARYRDASVDARVDAPPSTGPSTREEKRREDIKDEDASHPLSGKPDASRSARPKAPPKVNGAPPAVNGNELAKQAGELLAFLNTRAGKRFPETPSNLGVIVARLREGFTETQVRQVVAMKVRAWKADEKMREYLRPETLFGRTKFSSYVGELVPASEETQ